MRPLRVRGRAGGNGMMFNGTSRFAVLRLLGSGSTGSVYLVEDRQLGAQVALKVLSVAAGLDLYHFKREFRSRVDCKHPNLVALYELFAEGELWFFTMEHVAGVPFNRFLPQTSEPRTPDHAPLRAMLSQLCEGVQAVHEGGAIHRDLKPSNVLVTSAGRVVILDFGLARPVASSLSGGGIVGTPTHMAPEQAMEEPCTPAADWYAVGSMLYEVLAGRPPFQGSMFEVLLKKQSEDPVDPRTLRPHADPELSELCMQLMRRAPEQRPEGPEVLARLGSQHEAHPPRHAVARVPTPGVFGRGPELARLASAYQRVERGSLAVTLVQGASGIGKTSLVEAFLKSLQQAVPTLAPQILRGRCHEREALPFKAFDSVIDELSQRLDRLDPGTQAWVLPDGIAHLAAIFPVLRRISAIEASRYATPLPDARESRNQAFVACRALLLRLARLAPLVIFIDDLQWADPDSFALLRALLQQPGAPALHLVLACRPPDAAAGQGPAAWHELERLPGVDSFGLGPLGDADIRGLAEQRMGDAALAPALRQRMADSVAGEARGNPLFAVELVQHLMDVVLPDGAAAGLPADHRDYRLDGMILKRVGSLPEEGQRMLELVAVARDPLAERTLASAVGLDLGGPAWQRGLSALLGGRLLTRRGQDAETSLVVYHDRIAEAMVRHLDEPTVRDLYRQLAEAVERCEHERKDKLARYWLSADDHARAKRYAIAAAREAQDKLAFHRAAELYQTALALEPDDGAQVELLRALGDCRASDGHAIAAAEAYQRAATVSDAAQAVKLHHLAAEQLLRGGHIAQGLEILQGVLAESGLRLAAGPRRALLSVLWRLLRLRLRGTEFVERPPSSAPAHVQRMLDVLWSAIIGLGVVDILRSDDFLLRFLLLALKVGDLRRVGQGLAVLSGQLASLGTSQMSFARQMITKAEVLAHRSGDATVIGLAKMSRGVVHYFAGEWEPALADFTAVEEHFLRHCHGVGWELATTRSFICFTLRATGRMRELCTRFDRYTADADRIGDRYLAANLRTYMSGVWQVRGDIARARRELEGVLDVWPGHTYQVQHFFHLYARCELALYEDAPEVAAQAMAAEEAKFLRSALAKVRGVRGEYAWITGRLSLALAERRPPGERAPLLRKAMRGARYLRTLGQQTAVAMGDLLEAGACRLGHKGARSSAAELLAHAVEAFDATGAQSLAAVGRWWLGALLGGASGEELRISAGRWMIEQGIREPARFAFSMLPGFSGAADHREADGLEQGQVLEPPARQSGRPAA